MTKNSGVYRKASSTWKKKPKKSSKASPKKY